MLQSLEGKIRSPIENFNELTSDGDAQWWNGLPFQLLQNINSNGFITFQTEECMMPAPY